jgi:hypothetical protein
MVSSRFKPGSAELENSSALSTQALSLTSLMCRSYGVSGEGMAPSALFNGYRRSSPMSQHCHFDASRSLTARYAGLTGSPDESGKRRRDRGLARAGNARVRCGMIQFAWRFLRFQKNSALAQWFAAQTNDRRVTTRKTMIVALARKLLIALWRRSRYESSGSAPVSLVDSSPR